MQTIRRIFVEKKAGFDVEARSLYADLKENLGIAGLTGVRIVNRYDVAGLDNEEYNKARNIIFAEPPVDNVYDEELPVDKYAAIFAIEYLPGQYDQRADSAAQCIQILTQKDRPNVISAKVIILYGVMSEQEIIKIKNYCINPVEAREAALAKPATLEISHEIPDNVEVLTGFIDKTTDQLKVLYADLSLAMSFADFEFCQQYFKETEKRDPTITEIRVIDTYWSDHCRHTTFNTVINNVEVAQGHFTKPVKRVYEEYLDIRREIYTSHHKDICLMDIAVIGMKELKKQGKLGDLDESDEINACSIVVDVDIDGHGEEWLIMFKNETHNHPTEIEPFGGAATCLGGCIRDPLSGRSYVYQAMRITGSGDPRRKVEDTLPGKLPQRKITIGAASGYSSYGNQIGLATGHVTEIYDEGYIAKRMEIGAVVAAAPRTNVVREAPAAGDVVILVGGRTGRDGCGGATGSSKEHTEESLASCGSEVQKGNPPTERKIQRLFRNPEASRMIKRCNDFGAGGVSVSIGELTDGVAINLDVIPKKYEGLDGTELAISESQERMSVVVAAENVARFISLADDENLEATVVAEVTAEPRLKMMWRNKNIVDLSREFLNTNGVKQQTDVYVTAPEPTANFFSRVNPEILADGNDLQKAWLANLRDINVCSQKGLIERFDSSIGAGTVIMPFGGKHQLTPAEGMAAKVPVLKGETTTATIMTHGYDPKLTTWSPFHGAVYAVVEAAAKVVAMGGDYHKIRLTLQEYFEKLGQDKRKWGKPFGALLGALHAQRQLGIPAIGGKDSMSGTFMDLNVPPTLVAFAVATANAKHIISPEFKKADSRVVLIPLERDEYELPNFDKLSLGYAKIFELIAAGKVLAAHTVKTGGIAAAVSKMSFGNRIGMKFAEDVACDKLFSADYGSIILELGQEIDLGQTLGDIEYTLLGTTQSEPVILINNCTISLDDALAAWQQPLEKIFPTQTEKVVPHPAYKPYYRSQPSKSSIKCARPRVFIPVFPGTNCEYDSAKAFEQAGAAVSTLVVRNLTASAVEESVEKITAEINQAQIVMLPGGFSAGDEPDGSGKFIATMFRNPRIKEAIDNLLKQRDGLMLGICNGFQALIKLGLVPYGKIVDLSSQSPTLTYNKIGRHISCMAQTKIVSNLSPWLSNVDVGDIHTIALSHGEGRFVADAELIEQLSRNGQIAAQYVDLDGNPSNDVEYNANGSMCAIEAITSPDGRILGKMGHSERIGANVAKNVPGCKDQQLFAAGVKYFG
ncbi:MAG: phosphoribosylformylglycinamidine synthase [Negativicutes bacterium]|jgi:phosphoribosylformylglycinamidine synthase